MNWIKSLAAASAMVLALAGCGGGGNPGTSVFDTSASGATTGTGTTTTAATYLVGVTVQRSAVATNQITSTETVQAVATVTDSTGIAIPNALVTFSETGATLLTFAPTSKTALTDANGNASIDIASTSATGTGATTITASATVGTTTATASTSIAIVAGSSTGTTTSVPAAVNFIGSNPTDDAIVVKGAGGTGRSESAILTFEVVDASNAPINGVTVNFTINTTNGGATLSTASAVSNSSGLVTATVSSGSSPASIVVTADTATPVSVTSQSDTLIVSNSVPIATGFELAATKYNLDGYKTGDSSTVTAFVRDQFGNPVPDGVAVSFQTDYGVVATSTLGGCTTLNGTCSVDFRVQNPRGADIATIVGSVNVGDSQSFSDNLHMNMAGATGTIYTALDQSGVPVDILPVDSACKESFLLELSDGAGHAPAAGTTIAVALANNSVVTVTDGATVLDSLSLKPVPFAIQIDLTGTNATPACSSTGTNTGFANFVLKYQTPGAAVVFENQFEVTYPY